MCLPQRQKDTAMYKQNMYIDDAFITTWTQEKLVTCIYNNRYVT